MIPRTQWDSLKKGLGKDLDQDRAKGEFAGLARETPCDGNRAPLFPFPCWGSSADGEVCNQRESQLMAL